MAANLDATGLRAETPLFGSPQAASSLEPRVVRYADLRPCYNAFIDCRTPGSEAKENFTIIGPGVSENPDQFVHIAEPHGYNIGGARQPPGCVNSQHSHETAEVFLAHTGEWRFDLGEHGRDAQVVLMPGDVISIPTRMFRGFTATAPAADGSPGFLWAVLGSDNPGRVTWAPKVFDMAAEHGLILLEDGMLIDTAAGQKVPEHARIMRRTTPQQVAAMHVPSPEEAETCVWRSGNDKAEIIGSGGPLDWPHGFEMLRTIMPTGQAFNSCISPYQRVIFVHEGSVSISTVDSITDLAMGDTITISAQQEHRIFSTAGCIFYQVSQ